MLHGQDIISKKLTGWPSFVVLFSKKRFSPTTQITGTNLHICQDGVLMNDGRQSSVIAAPHGRKNANERNKIGLFFQIQNIFKKKLVRRFSFFTFSSFQFILFYFYCFVSCFVFCFYKNRFVQDRFFILDWHLGRDRPSVVITTTIIITVTVMIM